MRWYQHMRCKLLVIPVVLALLVAALGGAARADSPGDKAGAKAKKAIAAKEAQARQVLSEIASIDEELNMVSEQYDGARYKLGVLRKRLAVEQVAFVAAQKRYDKAEQRAARLAVYLYTRSHGSSLDVILGARSLGELLQLSDAEHQVSLQAAYIIHQAAVAKHDLELKVQALARDRAAAAATVKQIASVRKQILTGLEERRKLLGTVEKQVAKLQAAERARQARLAALARARLEAELAAQRKAAIEAAAKRQAELAAAAKAQARQAAAARAKAAVLAQSAKVASETTPVAPEPATTTTTAATTPAVTTTTTTTATTTTSAAATTPVTTAPALTVPTLTVPTVPTTTTTTTPSATTTTTAVLPPTPTLPGVSPVPAPVLGPLGTGHPEAAQLALAYLGVPYVWGGSTPSGFDCSGLVAYVYAQIGISLPHFAAAQYTLGQPVPEDQLQPGDLVFFNKLDHVGIYLGDSLFIDAPHTGSFVRIDSLNEKWYSKKYVGARRI